MDLKRRRVIKPYNIAHGGITILNRLSSFDRCLRSCVEFRPLVPLRIENFEVYLNQLVFNSNDVVREQANNTESQNIDLVPDVPQVRSNYFPTSCVPIAPNQKIDSVT